MKYLNAAIVLTIILPAIAHASGLQVSPQKLDFSFTGNHAAMQQIVVANPATEVQTFQIYAEDRPAATTADPDNFSLAPGERKTVAVKVDPRFLPAGFKTNLDVLASPLGGKNLGIAAGVKIPLSFTFHKTPVNPDKDIIFFIGLGLLFLILLGLFSDKLKMPRKKN